MTERSDTMPVIGRLDDQVEAVLINPLKRRRTADEEERAETPAPAAANEAIELESPDEASREGRGADASLPVWML
jgi:hypothetical protein